MEKSQEEEYPFPQKKPQSHRSNLTKVVRNKIATDLLVWEYFPGDERATEPDYFVVLDVVIITGEAEIVNSAVVCIVHNNYARISFPSVYEFRPSEHHSIIHLIVIMPRVSNDLGLVSLDEHEDVLYSHVLLEVTLMAAVVGAACVVVVQLFGNVTASVDSVGVVSTVYVEVEGEQPVQVAFGGSLGKCSRRITCSCQADEVHHQRITQNINNTTRIGVLQIGKTLSSS
ncbi:uncharacterized protein BCR38DRAFT_406443 [Pseudomassariella vexata]|uniref:Uncharacterized protein n=1 Tax=Pseudomassariella vexata TaxID=1141098 RepID=A0A1Y2EAF7_9PEZI|nr:uncharacterized protein BCR38DRAFT_406443 [Pseudomassariella vexata]ORY68522.1 hypothetical protein BCR38DRAFT_406443 [Pseudomassariella vexata]